MPPESEMDLVGKSRYRCLCERYKVQGRGKPPNPEEWTRISPINREEGGNAMDLGLTQKVALVTAASTGLGRACASTLAAEGATVVIASRNREALEQTAQEIRQANQQPSSLLSRERLRRLAALIFWLTTPVAHPKGPLRNLLTKSGKRPLT